VRGLPGDGRQIVTARRAVERASAVGQQLWRAPRPASIIFQQGMLRVAFPGVTNKTILLDMYDL
jgi:hypothetical protein